MTAESVWLPHFKWTKCIWFPGVLDNESFVCFHNINTIIRLADKLISKCAKHIKTNFTFMQSDTVLAISSNAIPFPPQCEIHWGTIGPLPDTILMTYSYPNILPFSNSLHNFLLLLCQYRGKVTSLILTMGLSTPPSSFSLYRACT